VIFGGRRGLITALLVGAIASMLGFGVFAQQATFSSKIAAVRVDVSVNDRGKVVRGLRPEDFEVRDNGIVQRVDLATFEQLSLNVHLAFDLSQSVSGERLHDLRTAGRAFLEALTSRDKASLLTFNHAIHLRAALTGEIGRVREALDGAQPSGDTALYDATYAALLAGGADDDRRDLMLVFSDGRDTASWLSSETVLQSARRSDVVVYGVSPHGSPSIRFLSALGAATGGDAFAIETTWNLRERFLSILGEFRERYLVSYSPEGVQRGGWHTLEVRAKGHRATVRARPGYFDREEPPTPSESIR